MIGKYSYCDILNVVKFVIGIALIGAGLYQWNIIGLIGIIPIVQFFQYRSNPSCAIPQNKIVNRHTESDRSYRVDSASATKSEKP